MLADAQLTHMNAATEAADIPGGAEQDPASDSAVAWPGYEKFGTVQDILDQNKCDKASPPPPPLPELPTCHVSMRSISNRL